MRTFFDDGLYCCNWRAVGIIALAMNLARLASKRSEVGQEEHY